MKIMIIGATGRTGKDLVSLALNQGNEVIAYVRHPQKISPTKNLTVVQGELTNTSLLSESLVGCNAVLVTLGNSISNSSASLFSFAIPNIIEAMSNSNVKRIISLSALGVGSTYQNTRYPYRLGATTFLKGNFADHEAGEAKLRTSKLIWTTIHPGPLFNGTATENPTVKIANNSIKMPRAPRTYREDVAKVMLDSVSDKRTFGQKILMCSKQAN